MSIAQKLGLNLDLGVNRAESASTQAKRALMVANDRDVLVYRQVVNTQAAKAIESTQGMVGDALVMPTDGGQYYLVFVRTSESEPLPALVRENAVIGFISAHHALTVAQNLGLLEYVRPIDRTQPADIAVISDVMLAGTPGEVVLGGDRHYFLVRVGTEPVLLAYGDVVTFICDQWALKEATRLELLHYEGPVDLNWVQGEKTSRKIFGPHAALPGMGQFYAVHIRYRGDSSASVLIPLGDAPATVLGLAIGQDHPQAYELSYQEGMLPV